MTQNIRSFASIVTPMSQNSTSWEVLLIGGNGGNSGIYPGLVLRSPFLAVGKISCQKTPNCITRPPCCANYEYQNLSKKIKERTTDA